MSVDPVLDVMLDFGEDFRILQLVMRSWGKL